MSYGEKSKVKELSQVIEESAVMDIKEEINKIQTESQIFQEQLDQYQKKTANLSIDSNFLNIGKKLKNDYFLLLGKIVDILDVVNLNVF